ncbi:Periplasmic beta-glucosidase precursor [Clavibacter michiganensis subsp. michiganensis]|uniref:Periplasmic beta-glucosidase n=1 Tax=Clavibacter michiganensis subsp. michiganensis TaxID=33013 RepID=A0A251XN43_CLAMM|nr:Periplasmic beta-glucosidase precursor [Clavibacter michiganensis subsp. michiganensis]OUE04846.1 Periplasmic beta-glucosidase precursor [Clavibacter michiganensis subsp. michiganensis]
MTGAEAPAPGAVELPEVSERVRELHARMTLEEKLAQIVGYWVDQGGEVVAPMQGEMATTGRYEEATEHGLGHLTRVYGTRPVDPVERASWLWAEQRRLRTETRLGIPALVHEECLTGLAAWQAATFPTPLAWGASFDPGLVEEMAALIGGSMRELGVHQGLAPVLDVIRDARWGRVDECIAEDPYVVGTIGTAYVKGLQSAGIHATLKHFVGYSVSQSGRNHAPAHVGPRFVEDVLLPPFEMAVLDGGVRSVMNSYAEIDGAPVGATPEYLTDVLRGRWGFDGVVVSDYFSVAFLQVMHAVAGDRGEAAELALAAGIDVELPTGDAYLAPLAERIRAGLADESLVDRAVLRVLAEKEELGLLDATFEDPPTSIDLDTPAHRDVARRLAEESVVLLANDGTLPLASADRPAPRRIALIGPNADSAEALMGCYSFANHVLAHHRAPRSGSRSRPWPRRCASSCPTASWCSSPAPRWRATTAPASTPPSTRPAAPTSRSWSSATGRACSAAARSARATTSRASTCRACSASWWRRSRPPGPPWSWCCSPAGRTRWRGRSRASPPRGRAAGVLPGRGGRIRDRGRALRPGVAVRPPPGVAPALRGRAAVLVPAPDPGWPVGGDERRSDARAAVRARTLVHVVRAHRPRGRGVRGAGGESFTATVEVRNTGDRDGTDVVQLYARDVQGSVTRPVAQLLGYLRLDLTAGESARVRFEVPTTRLAFTDPRYRRIVEPGAVELWVGPSSAVRETEAAIEIAGPVHHVTIADERYVRTSVEPVGASAGAPAVPERVLEPS